MTTPLSAIGDIQSLLTQLRSHAQSTLGSDTNLTALTGVQSPEGLGNLNGIKPKSFSSILTESLNKVNESQLKSSSLGERFVTGDNQVALSDAMIASQKANINLQTAIQVRNRVVSAYQNIMNMQI